MASEGTLVQPTVGWFTNETSRDGLTEHDQYFRVLNWLQ